MKRLLLLVFTLLLVGGAGGAKADENPSPDQNQPVQSPTKVQPDLVVNVGDLIALGPLTPGKLREVCAIVGFTPKVKPLMRGIFCYPSTKKGTPARNGYINIFLSWGKLSAPGGGRWTGTKKIDPWHRGGWPSVARPEGRGWTVWIPREERAIWQDFPTSEWPSQPVFTKDQLAGKITGELSGEQADGFGQGFYLHAQRLEVRCYYVWMLPGNVDLQWPDKRRGVAYCASGNRRLKPPYEYVLDFAEPWGGQESWTSRYDPTCKCDQ